MSVKFLFEFYVKARDEMAAYKGHRQKRTGIAVDSDFLAIMYQRKSRQAVKLEKRIRDSLILIT